MAATLSAIFRGVDEMSNTLDSMASSGEAAVKQWESAGDTASTAFAAAASGAAEAAQAASDAASATDFWTDKIGNYDKSAMEAVYSTEELVEMGFKSQEALEAEASAAEQAAQKVEEQARAAEDAAKEQENMGETGSEAVGKIEQALTAAGLTAILKETTEAVIELANSFSDAESIVVKATGATGDALDGLTASMMEAYATSRTDDLNDVAAAVGEINTRLGYTGETLTETTGLFLDFSIATGGNAAGSVRSITQLMNQWNVPANEMESILDRLTYAGQASGISVDTLSQQLTTNKAILDQLGFSLDEATAMFMNFELAGTNTTAIMTGFRTALSSGAISSLEELYVVFDQISGGAMTAAEASEMFGSRAGPAIVNAVNDGVLSLDDFISSLEGSAGTLKTTAETATTLGEKWTQASNSMSTAFSSVISPTVDKVSSALSGFVDGIGQFLNEHPVVTAALTAVAVGLGVVVVAVVAYTAAMAIASAATTVFGAIASTALWPITLIVAGVAALVAGIALLVNIFDSANQEFNELTAVSKQHYEQLEQLNDEYDEAVELYGENSEEAQRLAEEIAGLEAQYEATKMTIEEFIAENDALIESHDKLIESYNSSMEELDKEEKSTDALIGRLETLATKTNRTAGEQQQMEAIIDKLNEQVPELALNYDDFSGSVDRSVASVKALAEAEAEKRRQEANAEAYVQLLTDRMELEEQLAKATEQTAAAQERYDSASGWDQFWNVGKVKSDLEDFTAEQERLQSALDETNSLISEQEEAFEEAAAAVEGSSEVMVDYETAVNQAIQSVSGEISELVEKYDEAYASARDSIDGQIGLFDTMKTETELSISDMQAAMQSQIDYLATYTENLQKAAQYGLDEGLIASLSDGSEESAGYINAIIENIEQLGGSTEGLSEEAAAFVEQFNGQFQEVETAKDQFAGTVADMETEFSTKMGEIEARMDEAIDNMNMSEDAAAAAKETIGAYVSSIRNMTGEAHDAAAAVAAAAQSALRGNGISTVGIPGFATGTTDAPDMFVAGEEGPELIVGAGGSTVFPADETSKILAAAGRIPLNAAAPDNMELADNGESKTTIEKKITLEIAGSGAIDVSGPYDEERMTSLLFANLKPALMGLLKQEIYEEGDMAYEF